ncbi:MAG: SDR family NAD(P)-dependent oxidoreductase [Myxococcota bacterium]
MGLLDDKVAIVTGGGGGLGRAAALALAAEGARVLVNDTGAARDGTSEGEDVDADRAATVVEEIRAAGGTAEANVDDVSTTAGADGVVSAALDAFGRLDVLVNHAGIRRDKTLRKVKEENFDAVLAVELKGALFCIQRAAAAMVKQKEGGRIVNATGAAGLQGNFAQANYAAAQAGVYALTRTAAIELQKYAITVNAVAPIAKTRMTADLPMFQGMDTMTPEHVAPATLFLASPLCGDRTGFVLAASGSRMYAFRVVETRGKFKDDNAPWTAAEIDEHWRAIVK